MSSAAAPIEFHAGNRQRLARGGIDDLSDQQLFQPCVDPSVVGPDRHGQVKAIEGAGRELEGRQRCSGHAGADALRDPRFHGHIHGGLGAAVCRVK